MKWVVVATNCPRILPKVIFKGKNDSLVSNTTLIITTYHMTSKFELIYQQRLFSSSFSAVENPPTNEILV